MVGVDGGAECRRELPSVSSASFVDERSLHYLRKLLVTQRISAGVGSKDPLSFNPTRQRFKHWCDKDCLSHAAAIDAKIQRGKKQTRQVNQPQSNPRLNIYLPISCLMSPSLSVPTVPSKPPCGDRTHARNRSMLQTKRYSSAKCNLLSGFSC